MFVFFKFGKKANTKILYRVNAILLYGPVVLSFPYHHNMTEILLIGHKHIKIPDISKLGKKYAKKANTISH